MQDPQDSDSGDDDVEQPEHVTLPPQPPPETETPKKRQGDLKMISSTISREPVVDLF